MENTMSFAGIVTDAYGNFRCAECKRFVRDDEQVAGKEIKHSGFCASKSQPQAPKAPVAFAPRINRDAVRQGAVSSVLTDDEIVDAVRAGLLSVSDAMNRDY